MTPRLEKHLIAALRIGLAGGRSRLPEGGSLVWRWFNDLCRTRTGTGYGPNPITHSEIEAYARLYRWPLQARHVDMILAMDRVYLDHFAEKQRSFGQGRADLDNAPPMNLTAFDAVFGATP